MVNGTLRKGRSALGVLLSDVLISILLLLVLSFAAAIISSASENSTAGLSTYSLLTLLISSLISGFISAKRSDGFGSAATSVLVSAAVIMLVGLIAGGGKLSLSAVMNYLCYFGVGMAGAFIARRRASKGRRKKRKH